MRLPVGCNGVRHHRMTHQKGVSVFPDCQPFLRGSPNHETGYKHYWRHIKVSTTQGLASPHTSC